MIIQIYAIVSQEDAEALCKLGVDHIGIVVSKNGDPEAGILSPDQARKIANTVKEYGKIITMIPDMLERKVLQRYVEKIEPDIIHVCKILPIEEIRSLNDFLDNLGVELMYAIPVSGEESVQYALDVEPYVGFLMLDSPFQSNQMPGFVGATGKTHDWNISKKIVSLVYKPAILGGGLSPQNVQEAIKTVRPAGVDAKTSLDIPGGKGRKDIEKVRKFVEKVREVEKSS